jgi:hypothetical protein
MQYWIHPLSTWEPNLILFSAEQPSLRFLIDAHVLDQDAARELVAAQSVVLYGIQGSSVSDDGLEMREVHLNPQEIGSIIKNVYDSM